MSFRVAAEPPPVPRPTVASRWWPPLCALACAALLSVAAYAGSVALGAAVLVVGGLLVWGWPTLLDLPAPRSTVAALGGCVAYPATPAYYPPAASVYVAPRPYYAPRPYGYGYYYRPAPPPPPHWGPGPGWGPRLGYGPPGWGPRYGPRW